MNDPTRQSGTAGTFGCAFLVGLFLTGLASLAGAEPTGSAIPGNHPLTEVQAGELLISELRCTACHAGLDNASLPAPVAPDLSDAGSRIAPEFLRRFLAEPSKAHPGTSMPDLLSSRSEKERDQIAEALTHFLVERAKDYFDSRRKQPADHPEGKRLYHSVGCVACHGFRAALDEPRPAQQPDPAKGTDDDPDEPAVEKREFQPVAVSLEHVAGKYSVKSLGKFLFQPLAVRSSGRMPDLKLTPAESAAIADYLMGDQPAQTLALTPEEPLVAAGKRYFQELNCAACHPFPGMVAAPHVPMPTGSTPTTGCLSSVAGRYPRFTLEPAQVQAIRAALRADRPVDNDQTVIAKSLTAFRCIACHIRDDFGGVPEEYSPFFTTSEKNLGEDGRIPPPLTLLGAKLRPEWLKKVLFDGESVRPYMATRMPQYGTANLGHLPPIFARVDILNGVEMKIPSPESSSEADRQRERLLRKGGQELLGDKGVYCVACHNFNGKPAPVNKGIDLMTTYQRLQPGWFNSFVRNPGAFRPRIIMPYSWANGVAAHKTILDGNTDQQIEAIWYYLSLGTSAADPSGIRWSNTKLTVGEAARTHRGRSRVAGYRGIAVGLPEKLSYAFNAETGTLSAIWQGDFIGVDWNGQGSGGFNPASEPITLAQDVSFAQLADDDTPWPLLPIMTKDARVNPNPLYPKNVGYQFRGYHLRENSIPTFLYRSGTIEIEDRSTAAGTVERRVLRRVLQLESPELQTVWFRALTGEIRQESDGGFVSGRLRLTIPPVETKLRPLPEEPKQSELLLRLRIPQGQTKLELRYEPIPK